VAVSPFENVFFYFRGPSSKTGDDLLTTRQVEDNTTKAFINTLQLAASTVATSWLSTLGLTAHVAAPMEFFLQGGPATCAAPERRLVAITAGDEAADATWAESTADKGRIDAAIHIPEQLLVAVEAKVGAALDGGQLVKHASDWGIPTPALLGAEGLPAEWTFTTWTDIYHWARGLLAGDDLDAVSRFLLGQFAEYLEIIGVTPFAGIRAEDFALLAARRNAITAGSTDASALGDPAQAELIKARVRKLWDAILPQLTGAERTALGEIHVGSLKANDDRMWAVTNWGQDGVNLTFEIDADQVELDLVAWTADQAELFERWVSTPGAMEALNALGDAWEVIVWRRRAMKSQSGTPFWMHGTSDVIEQIPLPAPEDVADALAAHRADCEPAWERIAYHLRRSWRRDTVLAAGETLADQALAALRQALPLLQPINSPGQGPLPAAQLLGLRESPTLAAKGFRLAPDSDRTPLEWQIVATGPALMVLSPNGMHLRGMRYHLATWPGPGAAQATFVAFTVTKSYASQGRDGHIDRLYYGPDIRAAIRTINQDRENWARSEHYLPDLQPPDGAQFDEQQIIASLRAGRPVLSGGWERLDELAREAYRGGSERAWPEPSEPTVLTYADPDDAT
jgi:hypothetical protein